MLGPNTLTDGSGTNCIHSGNYGAGLGDTNLAYLSQSLATRPGQVYLLSFWMNNFGGYTPNQFQVNWNTNNSSTNTLFNQVNVGAINNWTNFLFAVTATGTNTTLQFGAYNVNGYVGLDEVTVLPVPAPQFTSALRQNSSIALSWYAIPVVNSGASDHQPGWRLAAVHEPHHHQPHRHFCGFHPRGSPTETLPAVAHALMPAHQS